MKIVVLAGGFSAERNVSLSSGSLICKALRENGHQAVLVDAYLGMEPVSADLFAALPPLPEEAVSELAPDLDALKARRGEAGKGLFGPNVLDLCAMADLVFIGLHGANGEDGKVQATLEMLGIAYTGSDHLSSALAMSKILTKQLVSAVGVRTAPWQVLPTDHDAQDALLDSLSLPSALKVQSGGSSLGVYLPKTKEDLREALQSARAYGDKILCETFISGREFSTGILDGDPLPPIEIIPQTGFYDYKNKYQPGATLEICPADLTEEETKTLQSAALLVHDTLGLSVYSRSDFILDDEGKAWFLEVNTLPGMTPTSLLPQEAAAAGISYHALCEKIVAASLKERAV